MNVLMLNYEYPPIGGGGGIISSNIAKGLAAKGCQVLVITSHYKGLPEREVPTENLEIVRLNVNRRKSYQSNPLEMWNWIVKSKAYCNAFVPQRPFDVCFANFIMPGGAVALFLKKRFGLPYVVISHGHDIPWVHARKLWPLYLAAYFKIKKALRNSERNFVQTPEMLNNLNRFYPELPKRKNIIIPNGFDLQQITARAGSENPATFELVSAGRLVDQKDPQTLLKAFLLFLEKTNEGHLIFAGDGPLRGKLEKMVARGNAKHAVHFSGKVPHAEVLKTLRNSVAYITTSRNEGMSMAMIEAAAMGLPIITTPVSGASQMVADNGKIVGFGDAKQAMKAMLYFYKLWKSGEMLINRSTCEKIRANYNWQKIVSRYYEQLTHIVNEEGSSHY